MPTVGFSALSKSNHKPHRRTTSLGRHYARLACRVAVLSGTPDYQQRLCRIRYYCSQSSNQQHQHHHRGFQIRHMTLLPLMQDRRNANASSSWEQGLRTHLLTFMAHRQHFTRQAFSFMAHRQHFTRQAFYRASRGSKIW